MCSGCEGVGGVVDGILEEGVGRYETQIHGWIKYNRQDKVKELTEDLVELWYHNHIGRSVVLQERKFGMPTYSRNHNHHRGSSRRR